MGVDRRQTGLQHVTHTPVTPWDWRSAIEGGMLSCIQTSLLAFSPHCEKEMQVHGQSIFFAVVVATILCPIADAQACSGCGCRGGPGYRGPKGRCVGWSDIGRTCSDPPTTHCSAEGPNAGADEAAKADLKAIEAGKPKANSAK